jgi:UDP-galactopyranose mutase
MYRSYLPHNSERFFAKTYKSILFSGLTQIIGNIFKQMSNEAFDIIIIGGGMVGTTLACVLG